jgi:putative endonuclease
MQQRGKSEIGQWGEDLALDYLKKNGYRLLARNWRFQRGEIDLIMKSGSKLVFVEVRTRAVSSYVPPYPSIPQKKWKLLRYTAQAYRRQMIFKPKTMQFDVVGVTHFAGVLVKIYHYENVGVFGRYG